MTKPEDFKSLILNLGCRPIAFHPAFAKLPGCDVNAALLLSQLLYWSSRGSDPNGWIYKTREKWSEETALGVRQVDLARKKLRRCGILREKLRDAPPKTYYLINFEMLGTLLTSPACLKQANWIDGNGNASLPETGKFYKEQKVRTYITAKRKPTATDVAGVITPPDPEDFKKQNAKKAKHAEHLESANERKAKHCAIVDAIHKLYPTVNGGRTLSWVGTRWAAMLKNQICHWPNFTKAEWIRCVENRFRSIEFVPASAAPEEFIHKLHLFIHGPLDRYGKTQKTNQIQRNIEAAEREKQLLRQRTPPSDRTRSGELWGDCLAADRTESEALER